jgi:hypothetical protein
MGGVNWHPPGVVFNAATILVAPLVGAVLPELVQQVPIGTMHLQQQHIATQVIRVCLLQTFAMVEQDHTLRNIPHGICTSAAQMLMYSSAQSGKY